MYTWYSPLLIGRYTINNKTALAARAEYYSDKHGVIISTGTANGIQTLCYSLNLDFTIKQNLLWRIEVRTFKSKNNLFEKSNGLFTSTCTWVATSVVLNFKII